MSIPSIGAVGFTPLSAPTIDAASRATEVADKAGGAEFGHLVVDGIDRLNAVQQTSDGLAVKAATGDLDAIHRYTIAATEAQVTTQLTVAVRNKALEAFNEIMRMPV
jgi:flagellar hook-basal body complex protein FliE